MIQVLAKGSSGDHLWQISVRGGEKPRGGGAFFAASHGGEAAGLEHSEELDLDGWRGVGDFVEKQSSSCGRLEEPHAGILGPRKGTANMPKELAFDQCGIERSGADRDPRTGGHAAVAMNSPRGQLFPGPGFAQEQDRVGSGGDERQLAVDGLHGRAAADELGIGSLEAPGQFRWFSLQGPRNHIGEGVQIKGLDEVVKRPVSKSAGGCWQVSEGRHHDHRNVGLIAAVFSKCGESINSRQTHIDGDDIGCKARRSLPCLFHGTGCLHGMTDLTQGFGKTPAESRFVIDDQHPAHAPPPVSEDFGRLSSITVQLCSRRHCSCP